MAVNQTRNTFFQQIAKEMESDKEIVIVSVDLAGPPFDVIRNQFPNRYISTGIAEQNAVAVACGLASCGKKPIVYAANPFPLLRALDQIRNGVCMMGLPVQIVGLGTGFSVSECGSTHFTLEDIALASLCQGLQIYSISDNKMAMELACALKYNKVPTYYRFGKWAGELLSHAEIDYQIGYRELGNPGNVAIVATGCTVGLVNSMSFDRNVTIYDWFKPSYIDGLVQAIEGKKLVIVVEEMLRRGGLASIILEECNRQKKSIPIVSVGIDQQRGYAHNYGSREYWLEQCNITQESLQNIMDDFLRR